MAGDGKVGHKVGHKVEHIVEHKVEHKVGHGCSLCKDGGIAAMAGDGKGQRAAASAAQLGLGGQGGGVRQGVGRQPGIQLLPHVTHIRPEAPAEAQEE